MVDVLIDARMICHSGIGTYLRGLLEQFRSHPFFRERKMGLAISGPLQGEVNGMGKAFLFRSPIYSLWEQMEYPFQTGKGRIWHAPHYNIPLMGVKKGVRLVVTIHDLIHWIFRKDFFSPVQAFYARTFLEKVVRQADCIIAVSKRTRDDLIEHFKARAGKIRVIYEGVADPFFYPPPPEERKRILTDYPLPERFFLYVGLIKPHKNLVRLISIFKKLKKKGRLSCDLVMVGKKDRQYPAGCRELAGLQTGEGIHYFSGVRSREELLALYASAQALVQPSLYEGFGLTVLEAMAAGTPVISSRAGSLPEVAGEATLSIDPYSDSALEQALLQMEEKASLRTSLSAQGRLRARLFNWQKTADETTQVYQQVLGS